MKNHSTLGLLTGLTLLAGAVGFASTVQAQTTTRLDSRQFNPSAKCSSVLLTQDPIKLRMTGMWTFGYLARANDSTIIVTPKKIQTVINILTKACAKKPNVKFDSLVEVLSLKLKDKQAGKTSTQPRTSSNNVILNSARILLRKFFAPGTDYVALTASLKPTENDIRSVYAEPLASALVARNERMFKPGIAIRPKPEQETFLVLLSTTKKLQQGHADLNKFPGGYKKVRRYFIKNVPIARFKFVKRGEKLGLAFDGLIFVNGRWVLIPKPWRALK